MPQLRHRSSPSPRPLLRLMGGLLVLALLPGLAACSGGAKPKSAAAQPPSLPQTPTSAPAPSDPAATPAPTDRPSEPPKKNETLIVIDDPAAEERPLTLAEAAARARRQRRESTTESVVSITNDNLSDYATGQVTLMEGEPAAAGDAAESPAETLQRDEQYWRQGVRDLRLHLRRAVDEAADLEQQIAGLRLRFYAEDDPYVRDGQIKPAWDRALERQRQVELEVKAYRRELDEFLEKGRRAGALPGWLREGLELEPERQPEAGGAEAEPGEPSRHYPSEPKIEPGAESPRQEPP